MLTLSEHIHQGMWYGKKLFCYNLLTLFMHAAVFRSSSFDRLHGLHFGAVLGKGQKPGSQTYRLPFHSGQADRCEPLLHFGICGATLVQKLTVHDPLLLAWS